MKSNNALIVILGTVTLDAVGIGLVMPVLPGLLRDIVHSDSIASHYGVLLAIFDTRPTGNGSDRRSAEFRRY